MKNKKNACYCILTIAVVCLITFSTNSNKGNKSVFAKQEKTHEWGDVEVYLTFDDAPGDKITEEILDVLKDNKVKATFFVVGNRIKGRESTIKRITEEGHSIGLHSYSHKFKRIYSSSETFIDEMQKTSDEIFDVSGVRTNIIRFPGGSKPYMTQAFLEKLHQNNYKIYDWNIPVSDGLDAKRSPDKFYVEATNTRKFRSPLIILMHCSGENENTVKALPSIIEYYKELGYEFKTITNDSPEYYFKVKK